MMRHAEFRGPVSGENEMAACFALSVSQMASFTTASRDRGFRGWETHAPMRGPSPQTPTFGGWVAKLLCESKRRV